MMFRDKVIKRLVLAILLLAGTMAVGVLGFMWFEHLDLLDALYMTIITMGTVGYEPTSDGFSSEGKIFIILLIIFTIGTFTYALTSITSLVLEGELKGVLKGYRVNKEINKLKDHIIILGLGRNGRQSAVELVDENVPFVAIESSQEVIDKFLESFPNSLVLLGDATSEDLLRSANISQAKGVISALSDDASNVFATLTVRELNPKVQVVARASSESTISKLKIAGASRVILPNVLGGRKMAKLLTRPALMDFVDLITGQGQSHLTLEQISCGSFSGLVGKSLRELDIRTRTGVLVLGMQDNKGKFELNPNATKPIGQEESLFIIGDSTQLESFKREFK